MSISKKEFYSDFLYGFNNNLIKWVLIPIQDFQPEEKEEESKTENTKTKPMKLELEVLFTYNKATGGIKLSGVQITKILGYPSSSLVFNSKDIQNITKTNSTYQFTVKSSPYDWEMTLSSKGVTEREDLNNENAGNIKKNKFVSSR